MEINGPDKVFFGKSRLLHKKTYLEKPKLSNSESWWFGHLYQNQKRILLKNYVCWHTPDMVKTLRDKFYLNESLDKNLYEFCELTKAIYTLIETSDLYRHSDTDTLKKYQLVNINESNILNKKALILIQDLYNIFYMSSTEIIINELIKDKKHFYWEISNDNSTNEIQLGDFLSSYCTFRVLKNSTLEMVVQTGNNMIENYYPIESNEGRTIVKLITTIRNSNLGNEITKEKRIQTSDDFIKKYY